MSFLPGISDTSLTDPSTKYRVWHYMSKIALPLSLQIVERNERVRLEMSPVYFYRELLNPLETIFAKGLQILADPKQVEPSRPPGHVYAEHTSPTARWKDEDLKKNLQRVYEKFQIASHFHILREDPGSIYYKMLLDGYVYILQEAKSSGRTLLGRMTEVMIPIEYGAEYELDGEISYKVLQRLVVKAGKDDHLKGRSKLGETNYDFMSFVLS